MSSVSGKDVSFISSDLQQSDYERLRNQCDSAMSELGNLRQQHAEIMTRCERAVQEAEYARLQNVSLTKKCEEFASRTHVIQANYEQVIIDREKLRQDYEEIVLLREQEKLDWTISKAHSGIESLIETTTAPAFETTPAPAIMGLEKENEDLKYDFDDLKADHVLLSDRYKKIEEESLKQKGEVDEVKAKCDSLIIERNTLKQQCTAAICGYEQALRDRDEAIQDNMLTKEQQNIAVRELEQAVKVKVQMSKEIIKLREERDSAMNEYKLVMSERDTVHQEIKKLQDDLSSTKEEAKKLLDAKVKVFREKEGLRQEIDSVLAGRDQAIKEMHDLRARLTLALNEKEIIVKKLEEHRQDLEMLRQERNAARKERAEAIVHRDRILKDCFEVKQLFESIAVGNSEDKEKLHVQFDKLSHELANALNMAEIAMTRRDFAFSERDKFVRELEEMKNTYAQVLKEKIEIRKELDNSRMEFKRLQSHYAEIIQNTHKSLAGVALEKNESLHNSHDSALGRDAPSYHLETLEIKKVSKMDDFGFTIQGGKDSPLFPHDASIFITNVIPGSPADGKLRINDCVISINNTDMTNVEYQTAYETAYRENHIKVTILRQTRAGERHLLQRVIIRRNDEKELGLSFDSGLHIKRIDPASAAADEERLSIGDKILSINGKSIEDMPLRDAKKLLKSSTVSLTLLKPGMSATSSNHSLLNHANLTDTKSDDLNISDEIKHKNNVTMINVRGHSRSPSAPTSLPSDVDPYLSANKHCHSNSAIRTSLQLERQNIHEMLFEDNKRQIIEQKRTFSECFDRNPMHISPYTRPDLDIPSLQVFLPTSTYPNMYRRENSGPGSRQSVASGSSIGKPSHCDDGPHVSSNTSKLHPLSCSPRPVDICPSTKSSTTTVNSASLSKVSTKHPLRTYNKLLYPATFQDVLCSKSNAFKNSSDEYGSPANSHYEFSVENQYGTFPRKGSRSLPHTDYQLLQSNANTVRINSIKFGVPYKSSSSYGSLNSSDLSDRGFLGVIPPVNEESLESLAESFPQTKTSSGSVTRYKRNSGSAAFSQTLKSDKGSTRSKSRTLSIERKESATLQSRPYLQRSPRNSLPPLTGTSNFKEEDPRVITIEKGQYPLGITISQGPQNGIFVDVVHENSIAMRNGLQYGDQLLEYNGINLRNANYDQAARILKQSAVESTVTILAQYNLAKMHDPVKLPSSHLSVSDGCKVKPASSPSASSNFSSQRKENPIMSALTDKNHENNPLSIQNNYDKKIASIQEDDTMEDPRDVVVLRSPTSAALGLCIIGGNAVGIFISNIAEGSLSDMAKGLKAGDQILKYNGKDMKNTTREEATLELGKPTDVASFTLQYNPAGYVKAQTEPGDAFYVRAMFDRNSNASDEYAFRKGDVLYVINTLYKGQLGIWEAMGVTGDDSGAGGKKGGKIPSRMKAEQELLLRKTTGEDKLKSRYSLFRRSKKGYNRTVSHSRESSDSKGDDTTAMESSNFSVIYEREVVAYEDVLRYNSNLLRPVVILGVHAEPICDKLVMECPYSFARCLPEISRESKEILENKFEEGIYVDFAPSSKGTSYACVTLKAIRDVTETKSKHCLLDIRPSAVERLVALNLHPIIIFIKYKTFKHIKLMKDGHYIKGKITSKLAREMFESNARIEKDFHNCFTLSLYAHSLNSVCKEVSESVLEQQRKSIWIRDHNKSTSVNNILR